MLNHRVYVEPEQSSGQGDDQSTEGDLFDGLEKHQLVEGVEQEQKNKDGQVLPDVGELLSEGLAGGSNEEVVAKHQQDPHEFSD